MSCRRRSNNSRLTQEEINDLVLKLQSLLPNSSSRCNSRVPASKILEETCNYIRMLHGEVDDLSERLSQVLSSVDTNTVDLVDTLLSRLQQ